VHVTMLKVFGIRVWSPAMIQLVAL